MQKLFAAQRTGADDVGVIAVAKQDARLVLRPALEQARGTRVLLVHPGQEARICHITQRALRRSIPLSPGSQRSFLVQSLLVGDFWDEGMASAGNLGGHGMSFSKNDKLP